MDTIRKFITFGMIGVVATAIQYIILIVLVRAGNVDPVTASTVGFGISAFANYALNYRYTFQSTKKHFDALPKFALIALSGLAFNTLIMAVLVHWFGWHYLLSQVASTGTVLVWNFTLNRMWAFRDAAPSSTSS